jgi:hypothetical protein
MPDMQITNPESAPIYDAGNLREGSDRGTKVLFAGDEGRLDNYRWFYSAPGVGDWKAPRHRHNFEQIRFALEGRFEYRPDDFLDGGNVIYFPEGVHYGPQVRHDGLSMLTLQYGGATGNGYLSQAERKKGFDDLCAKGKFEKGYYTWLDAEGRRHNQDSFEAIWEHMMGRNIVYPEPRYSDLIKMNADNYGWTDVSDSPGVAMKWLASLTERAVRVGFIKLDAGATTNVGGLSDGTELLFLINGDICHDGQDHPEKTAFRCNPGEGLKAITATQASTLFRIQLPRMMSAGESAGTRNAA